MTIRRTERTAKTAQAKENAMTKRYDSHQAVAMNNNGTDNAKGTSMTKRIILAGMALACSFFMTTSMALAAAPNPNNDQIGCSKLEELVEKAKQAANESRKAYYDACEDEDNLDSFIGLIKEYERYLLLRNQHKDTQSSLILPTDLAGFLQEAIDAETKAWEEYQSTTADYNAALEAGEPDHVLSELYDVLWVAYEDWVEKSNDVDDARDALTRGSAEWSFQQAYIDQYDWAISETIKKMQAIRDMFDSMYDDAKSAYDAWVSARDAYNNQGCQPPIKENDVSEPGRIHVAVYVLPPGP